MFSLRHVEEDRWTVISEDDEAVFVGTLRECEDWLDAVENLQRPSTGLLSWLRRLFDTKKSAALHQSKTKDPTRSESIRGEHQS